MEVEIILADAAERQIERPEKDSGGIAAAKRSEMPGKPKIDTGLILAAACLAAGRCRSKNKLYPLDKEQKTS